MSGKTILITGCSEGGIGAATAKKLAVKGYNVLATVRNASRAADLTSTDNVIIIELDVRDDASVKAALEKAGEVDVLINNAGFEVWGPLEEMTLNDIKDQFETNVYGPFRLILGVLPQMRNRGSGVIINVSSVAGRVAAPLNGLYAASKFALEAMTESLFWETGHFGIRLHLIEPGLVGTQFSGNRRLVGAAAGKESPYTDLVNQWETVTSKLAPEGRATPEQVADVIVEAVENGSQFRYPATPDAKMVFAARKAMDDAQFEAAMRQQLGLTW